METTDERLAQEVEEAQYVLFHLDRELYGVPIAQVQEIVARQRITTVPGAPDFVEGVTNLRGQVIPVINLAKRLDLPPDEDYAKHRIIVVELPSGKVGMDVHGVDEVASLPSNLIEPPGSLAMGISAHYISGLARRDEGVIVLLDLEAVLSPEEIESLEKTGTPAVSE